MQKNQWYAGFNALRAFRYAITRNNETGYPERNKLITRSNNPQLFISERARLRILPRSLSTPNRKVGWTYSVELPKDEGARDNPVSTMKTFSWLWFCQHDFKYSEWPTLAPFLSPFFPSSAPNYHHSAESLVSFSSVSRCSRNRRELRQLFSPWILASTIQASRSATRSRWSYVLASLP